MTDDEFSERDRELRARIDELLANHRYGYAGFADAQRSVHQEIAVLEARIVGDRVRAEVRLDVGRRALTVGLLDDAADAVDQAKAYYERVGRMPRRVGDCWTQLAAIRLARLDFDGAEGALRAALAAFRVWNEPGDDDVASRRVVQATVSLTRRLTMAGRHHEALATLRLLDDASHTATDLRLRDLSLAEVRAAQGAYGAAESILDRITRADDLDLAADIASARGYVLAASGRLREALARYTEAMHLVGERLKSVASSPFSSLRAARQRDELLVELGERHGAQAMNVGAVLGALGDHDEARAMYRRAVSAFDQLPLAGERRAECQLNEAVEALAVGDVDRAEADLHEVDEFLSTVSELSGLRAGCSMNLGLVHDRRAAHGGGLQEYGLAITCHRRARDGFLAAGMPEWAARAAINLGSSAAAAERSGVAATTSALADLLPALVFLDRMRFQFPTAAARSAWKHTVLGAAQLAFDLAADDPALLAELIENAINGGVHSARRVDVADHSAVAIHDRLGHLGDNTPAAVLTSTAVWESSAGRLIAGAVLPMHPPPPITMPDGTMALQDFHRLAEERYGPARVADAPPRATTTDPG